MTDTSEAAPCNVSAGVQRRRSSLQATQGQLHVVALGMLHTQVIAATVTLTVTLTVTATVTATETVPVAVTVQRVCRCAEDAQQTAGHGGGSSYTWWRLANTEGLFVRASMS